MAHPSRSSERTFEPTFGPAAGHAGYGLDPQPVRALQRRLSDAFAADAFSADAAAPAGAGLAPAGRIAVIAGSAAALWIAIGAVVLRIAG